MNPYILPEGNVQIAFSGGRTSAYMLHHILEANGGLPDRAKVVFANTGREMPETLDFVQEVSERWAAPVVWVEYRDQKPGYEVVSHNSASRDGEPFEALIRRRRFLPNQQTRFCTQELKIRPVKRVLVADGWARWTTAVGLRADEHHRIARDDGSIRERAVRWYPLANAGVSKHDVALFWRNQPFDLRLQNVNGNTALGNCDGCFLKSEASLAMLARDHPERHAWWERMEALATDLSLAKGVTPGRGAWFSKRYTRVGLRDFVERQGDWIFDTEDALCQADGGECIG